MRVNKFKSILLDISNIYHRSYATSSHLTFVTPKGVEIVTGGVLTSLKTIRKIRREFLEPRGKIYCLLDATRKPVTDPELTEYTNYRKEIDPDYKAGREPKPDVFYEGMNALYSILNFYGEDINIVEIEGLEADDLVKPLLEIIQPSDGNEVLLVSGDLDWARTISDRVYWQNHQKEIHNRDSFYEKYDFYPEKLALQKAFRGDGSDGIPKGVKGIKTTSLNLILEKYSDVKEVYENIDRVEFLSQSWKDKIKNNFSRLKLNEQLIAFIPVDSRLCQRHITKSSFQPKMLRMIYKSLGFRITEIDPRLLQEFPEEKPTAKNFFKKEKISRI